MAKLTEQLLERRYGVNYEVAPLLLRYNASALQAIIGAAKTARRYRELEEQTAAACQDCQHIAVEIADSDSDAEMVAAALRYRQRAAEARALEREREALLESLQSEQDDADDMPF